MSEQFGIVRSLFYQVRTDQYPRIGHRIIFAEHQILIFGGVSNTGEYNTTIIKVDCETMTLDLVHSKNTLKLQGFTIFNYEDRIYFWGGSGPSKQDAKSSICQNKLINFVDEQFVECEQKGRLPTAREYHSSCVTNKGLIIMGGNNGRQFFNDWYMLEFKSMTWFVLELNQTLFPFLDALLFWNSGRGFVLTGEQYDQKKKTVICENRLYEFKFSDFKAKKITISPINVSYDSKQKFPRGVPIACFANLESPYIILLGGTRSEEGKPMEIRNNVECFNLETLEWFQLNHAPMAGLGFQALYSGEKVFMVGGLNRNKQLFQHVEYIQFKTDYLQAKVCRSCRQLYGLRNLTLENQNTNIKYESTLFPKTFLSAQVVGKFSSYMNYPFSAFGLLIDNCLNLSGSNIDINFGKIEDVEEKKLQFDYISIIDNSMGFNSFEILDSLCSFTIKTQKLTSDKRYEEQIEIRKEYGVNLKLGALRLGKSCLYMTKVEDKEERSRLFAYFSTTSAFSSSPFSVHYYILSQTGQCSSDVTRHLIERNVHGKIPADYQTKSAMTLIYIFDFDRVQLELRGDSKDEVYYNYSTSKIYRCLEEYVQTLYLRPYTGRTIRINNRQIKFREYLDILKADEVGGKVLQLNEQDYQLQQSQSQYFEQFNIYRIVDKNYFLRDILCYHKNRLIFTLKGIDDQYCGIVEFSSQVKVDICKTKLQNRAEELAIYHKIRTIMNKHKQKRVMNFVIKPGMKTSPLMMKQSNSRNM